MQDKSSFYITTPIYYVNDIPHIGHAYTTVVCDTIARFMRWRGKEVRFLTGTDEHGQKVEKSAIESSLEPQIFTDKVSERFKNLTNQFNITNDDFIRTTEERHKKSVTSLWNTLLKNGNIYLDKYSGWYSVRDEAFYNIDELSENNKGEKIAPNGSILEWIEEPSFFFKLSSWQENLLKFYKKNPNFVSPKSRYNEVLSFVSNGLEDLSISRTSFKWGISVPHENNHVIYVWLDALTNYISALEYPDNKSQLWKKFWPADIHVVGKDILRFHAVYWPAFLMAAGIEPPKRIFAHGWWTNEGKKISKSLGNVINPKEVIEKYGLDTLRYFLLREIPFGNDGDFSIKSLTRRINNDLANDLGNLIQRVLTIIYKNFDGRLNKINKFTDKDKKLFEYPKEILEDIEHFYEQQEFHKVIEKIWGLISKANKYVDEVAPWDLVKKNLTRAGDVLSILVIVIVKIGIYLYPIMPNVSESILNKIGLSINKLNLNDIKNNNIN